MQRRRWSNGGLIILPSVFAYLFTQRRKPRHLLEGLLRIHYMIMPACISVSMLLMLLYPFDFKRVSGWIYLTLPPYLYLVTRDLKQTGYRRTDIFKAYTLFLILLPVVLAGVKNSVLQIVYGTKSSFGRTPKVDHRTAAPASYHLAIAGLLVWSIITAYSDLTLKNEFHALFALSNAVTLAFGMVALIGLKETAQDMLLALKPLTARFSKHGALPADVATEVLVPAGLSPALQPAQKTIPSAVGIVARESTAPAAAILNASSAPGSMPTSERIPADINRLMLGSSASSLNNAHPANGRVVSLVFRNHSKKPAPPSWQRDN